MCAGGGGSGSRIGRYEFVRVVATGGTATVYEGRHPELRRHVAVKVLHEHLASRADVATRFLREGAIASAVRHPNVVRILEVAEDQGTPFLVMELLDGEDLCIAT